MTLVNPDLMKNIKRFSTKDFSIETCFDCGNCTALCNLATINNQFPRKLIRYGVLGLDDKLLEHPEPWLCFYCGECSETCPRQASPGEFMMATRRYFTTRYDWTGLSRRFYLSKKWEIGAIIVLALGILGFFILIGAFNRMNPDHVSINFFAPVEIIYITVLSVMGILTLILLSNAFRMYYYVILKDKKLKIPFSLYITQLKTFIVQILIQKKWIECRRSTRHWLKHLIGVTAEATIFLFIIILLPIFQRDNSQWHWSALPAYYATAILTFLTIDAIVSRMKKKEELHRFSHLTDWVFLIMPLLTLLTGMLLHLFRLMDLPYPSYYMYVIHLMIAGSMMIIEVPFGKWSHVLYRPLGIYLASVKEKARILEAI